MGVAGRHRRAHKYRIVSAIRTRSSAEDAGVVGACFRGYTQWSPYRIQASKVWTLEKQHLRRAVRRRPLRLNLV
jgi:hypothetical protein